MLKLVISSFFLFVLWMLLSGLFKPLLLYFGIASSCLAGWLAYRMDRIDGEDLEFTLNPINFLIYMCWLLKEVALSSLKVTRIICSPSLEFRQKIFSAPTIQEEELQQVMFANSITLTPGTVTVETEPGYFLVHALDHQESDFDDLADMDQRISKTGLAKRASS